MPHEAGPIDQDWLTMHDRLKAYREEYGDCLVPRRAPLARRCLGGTHAVRLQLPV